ncbi:MAG: hypothetical protein CMJ59_23680 [Planctomycetaceae bacterium]|nr:hypothetical protein [Planctomycetaceae bacterium]
MTTNATATMDPKQTKLTKEVKHNRPLTTCFWDPLSRYVFFGAEDHFIHRFDITSGKVSAFAGHDSWVRALVASADGKTLYSAGYDGRLIFWEAAANQPKPQRTIEAHQGWVRAVTLSRDGKYLATCGNDRMVKVWRASDGQLVKEFTGHKTHVYNVVFQHDSKTLVSCDHKGVVKNWSLSGTPARELLTVKAIHGYDTTFRADIGGARGIAIRSDGTQLALSGISKVTNAFAGVGEAVVALVDLTKGTLDRVLQPKDKLKGTMWGVAHHPAGFWIGLSGGSGGGSLSFWQGDTNHEQFKLKLKHDGRGMSVSPDHQRIAVAHADAHLRLYQLQSS